MIMNEKTHVLQYGLHQRDSDFCLLHEVVLCILHLETGMLLFSRIGVLQANRNKRQFQVLKTKDTQRNTRTSASQHPTPTD